MSRLSQAINDDLSDLAMHNVNNLLKVLKARLSSSGKQKDAHGNEVEVDIFTINQLVIFLATALEAVNTFPPFTNFSFEDTKFIEAFSPMIVQYATYLATTSKALIERGREFKTSDNGIDFEPPRISEVLMQLGSGEFDRWAQMVKECKPMTLSSYFSKATHKEDL